MIYRSTLAGAVRVPLWLLARPLLATGLIVLVTFCLPPWVLLDPIDRFTFLDGKARSMIPEVFAAGESRSSAQTKLSASGYYQWPVDRSEHHELNSWPRSCLRPSELHRFLPQDCRYLEHRLLQRFYRVAEVRRGRPLGECPKRRLQHLPVNSTCAISVVRGRTSVGTGVPHQLR